MKYDWTDKLEGLEKWTNSICYVPAVHCCKHKMIKAKIKKSYVNVSPSLSEALPVGACLAYRGEQAVIYPKAECRRPGFCCMC